MIRNLAHALASAALILVVGQLTAQPSIHRQLAGSQGARYAVLGLIVVLALFTAVSVVLAFRPKRKPPPRPSFTPAAPVRRGR
jgi:hypothetical protein